MRRAIISIGCEVGGDTTHWLPYVAVGGAMVGEVYDCDAACGLYEQMVLKGKRPASVVSCPDCVVEVVARVLRDSDES